MHSRLDEAFSFMCEVKWYGSPTALVDRISELKKFLKGRKLSVSKVELQLETLASVSRDVQSELEEKRTDHSKELGVL